MEELHPHRRQRTPPPSGVDVRPARPDRYRSRTVRVTVLAAPAAGFTLTRYRKLDIGSRTQLAAVLDQAASGAGGGVGAGGGGGGVEGGDGPDAAR
jgi:hypothetical protein